MARDSFVFYRSFFEAISLMPPEVQAEVYPSLVEYALNGKEPKGLSDIAQGVFILVKPNIDASIARKENGKKFGKLGGRPKKGKAASSAKSKGEVPASSSDYTLTLLQEIDQLRDDRTWNEPVCMQFHISPEDFSKRLDAFLNHCQCEFEGKPHKDLGDAKRHFMSWSRKAYPPVERADTDDELPPPSYEFNGGFGGQDI
mgnify:FL=1